MLNFVYFLVSLHFLGKSAFFNTFHPADINGSRPQEKYL